MKPPAFQFYPDDFLGGTVTMTNEERGLYIMALCLQWTQGGISPDDLKDLGGAIAQPSLAKVRRKFILHDDGMLRNARLESVRKAQDEFRKNRKESGEKGARSRWHSHSTAMAQPMTKGMANDSSPSPTPSPSPKHTESVSVIEEIAEAYPRKSHHRETRDAISIALQKHPAAEILEGTRRIALAIARLPSGAQNRYVVSPPKFFLNERWKDDPEIWVPLDHGNPEPNGKTPAKSKPLGNTMDELDKIENRIANKYAHIDHSTAGK